MNLDGAKIRNRLKSVLQGQEHDEESVESIVFHLTDWLHDLEALYDFYEKPDLFDDERVKEMLTGFLVHVPNHVAAAAKLLEYCPVQDIFCVGAVDLTYEEKVNMLRLRLEVWGENDEKPPIDYPSGHQIRETIEAIDGDKYFAARIGLHDWFFLQINIEPEDDYRAISFQAGSDEDEFKCASPDLSLEAVIKAFQQFAIGDHSWKDDFEWRKSR